MKLTIYSPSVLPGESKKHKRFAHTELLLMTINPIYGRIYLSTPVVKKLDLFNTSFQFGRNENGTWFLIPLHDNKGFKLKSHGGAFYFLCRPLVNTIIQDFPTSENLFLLVSEDVYKIGSYHCYMLSLTDSETIKKGGKSKQAYRTRGGAAPDPSRSKASAVISNYLKTYFPGRIKTQEVLSAEHRLGIRI